MAAVGWFLWAYGAQAASIINPFKNTNMASPVDSVTDGYNLLMTALKWIYTVFFVIATMYILFAAYSFTTSGGDKAKVDKAKKQLLYAVVAIVIALLNVTIIYAVKNFLNAA